MMKVKNNIKYKGHVISCVEDEFKQNFTIIDGCEKALYANIADAKRVIRGERPIYIIV